MDATVTPRVSFIIPTLNAEAILDNCLASIARQDYPRDRYEIVIADAHSTDRTREIAKKYGAIVLDDNGKDMEEGKRLALQHATGDFIFFVDSDNEFSHGDFVGLAVRALAANPNALGVESYYLASPRMSSFCAYVTQLLHISDCIAWVMTTQPQLVARESFPTERTPSAPERPSARLSPSPPRSGGEGRGEVAHRAPGENPSVPGQGEVERWTLPEGVFSYPLGANGFLFRRADLESVKANEQFQDTHAALHLMRAGKREWLRISGRGVHHYYVQTLWGYVQKRRRATVHFLRVQEKARTNWMKEKPAVPLWLAVLYCGTLIGPLWHTAIGIARDRDLRWLWHAPACFAAVVGCVWGVFTYKVRGRDKKLIAELQVKQTLKKE